MEGVGARLGRSSSRYGPTTVFTGPVRRWKKKWAQIAPPSSGHMSSNSNGNAAHLLLFKWTPISPPDNGNSNGNGEKSKDGDADGLADERPKRKFKYIPVAVLEEQKLEASEQAEDETGTETDTNVEATSKSDELDDKPDINDVPMEESQDAESKPEERQDLNESLDLSLGFNSPDGNDNSQSKTDQTKDEQPEKI